MTAEDEWFDHEHPHGRDGLGPPPENPLRAWTADYLSRPFGGVGDGADTPRPNVTWRTRDAYMTAGVLRNALNYANDSDRVVVHGRELRIFKQD